MRCALAMLVVAVAACGAAGSIGGDAAAHGTSDETDSLDAVSDRLGDEGAQGQDDDLAGESAGDAGCTGTDTCVEAECDGSTHECTCELLVGCAAFEDGDLCNGTLHCSGGKCLPKWWTVVTCPALPVTECLTLGCVPETGKCEPVPVEEGAGCDDGNACTTGDTCKGGTCRGTPTIGCECLHDEDCAGLNDGDPCNGTVACLGGECVVDPATVVVCVPDWAICRQSKCDPGLGACVESVVAVGSGCSDGNVCTDADRCDGDGVCVGNVTGFGCPDEACEGDADCVIFDDHNLCNGTWGCGPDGVCIPMGGPIECPPATETCHLARCIPSTGHCVTQHAQPGTPCDDGDPCTVGESCVLGGECVGTPIPDCE